MNCNVRIAFALTAVLGTSCAVGALKKYDLSSYVQNGLVVHLDGICNKGPFEAHDPLSVTWANLADAENPAIISGFNPSAGWRDCGYYFSYDSINKWCNYARLEKDVPTMTAATFEFVVDAEKGEQKELGWGCTFFSGTDDQRVCCVDADGQIRFKADLWTGNSNFRPSIAKWGWKQASFTLGSAGDGNFKAYDDGVLKDSKSAGDTGVNTIPATQWMVGNKIGDVRENNQFTGVMKSFRIYNRVLDAEEVALNAIVDAFRFDGVLPITNAVIETSVAGIEGTEPSGIYAVDGTHVFTVPPSVTRDSVTYVCMGYTRENWEGGDWGEAVNVDGFSVTVSESEKVRITWRWAVAPGILGKGGIDAYSTEGIKVWYDGIRNVGKDKPHADEGVWHELVSGQPANMVENDNSHWDRDGYHFASSQDGKNRSYVYLRQLVSLGTVGTIEIACDVRPEDQTAEWPKFVTFGYTNTNWDAKYENKMAVQAYKNEKALRLADDAWTGNSEEYYKGTEYANYNYRANTSTGWDGKYAAFVVDSDNHRSYRKGCRDVVKPRAILQEMPAAFWMLGNTYYNGTTATDQLVGTIKAVRAYGRVLSDAEISRHYSIDVWRFDGTMPISNAVMVVEDARGFSGRETADVYFPIGWTFSSGAQRMKANGKTFKPSGYVVEEWDAETGVWRTAESSGRATEWVSPVALPFASRRLKWRWKAEGLSIVLR